METPGKCSHLSFSPTNEMARENPSYSEGIMQMYSPAEVTTTPFPTLCKSGPNNTFYYFLEVPNLQTKKKRCWLKSLSRAHVRSESTTCLQNAQWDLSWISPVLLDWDIDEAYTGCNGPSLVYYFLQGCPQFLDTMCNWYFNLYLVF